MITRADDLFQLDHQPLERLGPAFRRADHTRVTVVDLTNMVGQVHILWRATAESCIAILPREWVRLHGVRQVAYLARKE